jgi:replicative DNA helicase
MPNDLKAEQAVVGSMIMEALRSFEIVTDAGITEAHFYNHQTAIMFAAAMQIGDKCDLVQMLDQLGKDGVLEKIGEQFIHDCADASFVSHLQYHCEILKDKLHRRKIIMSAHNAIDDCGKDLQPIEIASEMAAVAVEISDTKPSIDKAQIIADSLVLFDNAYNGIVSGVPLPWDEFSKKVGGIQRRCVCPLLGRDGAGKSFMVTKILSYLGKRGIPALSMPFEDGADRQMRRMAGCIGGYATGDVERAYFCDEFGRYHKFDHEAFDRKKQIALRSMEEVAAMPIYFEDACMTVEQIRVVAGKYKRKHKIEIMFIDGVKDIIPSKGENATKQEEHISRVMVQTAKELDIAIVPVCHLTDIPEDTMIQRRNMRGAKSQFHNARQVLIYQNAGIQDNHYLIGENTIALHMEKNNYGRESMLILEKDFDHCDFVEGRKLGY